jgi:hypothetical protein
VISRPRTSFQRSQTARLFGPLNSDRWRGVTRRVDDDPGTPLVPRRHCRRLLTLIAVADRGR